MSNNINLSTFPSNKIAALTMLYLQNQDLSDIVPSELAQKYDEVYSEIKAHYDEIAKERHRKFYSR
jgi:hypothetical protein